MAEMTERQQSLFDSALSYIYRLNNLFYSADQQSIKLDLYSWFNILIAIYRELSTEMKPDELKDFDFIMGDILQDFQKVAQQKEKGGLTADFDIYRKLHSFEMQLRFIYKESGLMLKSAPDLKSVILG